MRISIVPLGSARAAPAYVVAAVLIAGAAFAEPPSTLPPDGPIPHVTVEHVTLLDETTELGRRPSRAVRASYQEEVSVDPPEVLPLPEGRAANSDSGETILSIDEYGPSELFAEPPGTWADRSHNCNGCPCGLPEQIWITAEYLYWLEKGMDLPPLVTTSPDGTGGSQAGVLGIDGTQILFGNSTVFDDWRDGVRLRAGAWLDDCRWYGLEGEYFGLFKETLQFRAASDDDGSPILARPFFNMNPRDAGDDLDPPAREDSELVALPDLVAGTVTVDASTTLYSAGARLRINLCCKNVCRRDPCTGASGYGGGTRLDLLLGYRYMRLQERLRISEALTSLDLGNPGQYDIFDQFDTSNDFHGGEIGAQWRWQQRRWSLEILGKLGVGNNHQAVEIDGGTVITPFVGGPDLPFTGGLLAQRTNIGTYSDDEFAVIPEIGLTVGFRVTPHLHVTAGYTFLYLSRVARPGDQIDQDVNPDLLPPEVDPVVGPLRPEFAFAHTDYWVQGLNLGLALHW